MGKKRGALRWLMLLAALALLGGACAGADATPAPGASHLFVFSNNSPHVSVINTETNPVERAENIPALTTWSWNDDNNYFDGQNLWLGMRDPDSNDGQVIALDLDTLEVASSLAIGKEEHSIYIGKVTRNGVLHVAKQASGKVVTIDTKSQRVLDTWTDVPVNGDAVCDADIAMGPDGIERFYYPTRRGDTVVSINPETGETIKVAHTPKGFTPHMLTTAPDGNVWVQESGSNSNAVFDPVSLDLVKRIPAGEGPVVASFSPDGKYAYIGHLTDSIVQVVDAGSLTEVKRVSVGTSPSKLAVDPSGKFVYAILTKEASVSVIDTGSWEVIKRIPLGTNPSGIYLRAAE